MLQIKQLQEQEKLDVASHDLVLQQNQMIFIPKNVGITHCAVSQKRLVYINNFVPSLFTDFMTGADNITAIKQINDVAICPMLDTENQVIGLYYFYNASQG